MLADYDIETDGYSLVVRSKNEPKEILCFADLVDQTVIVPDANRPGAIEAANMLGAKRFIYRGDGNVKDAISFERDRMMDTIEISKTEGWTEPVSFLIGQKAIAESEIGRSPDFYSRLSFLFAGAEFTPGKMKEYEAGEADKFCRVNAKYITPIVMLDSEKSLLGFIRIAIIDQCAYLSDEMVKMVKPEVSKDSPEFLALLGHLFNAAKNFLKGQGIAQVLIRAAADRVALYETLGCKAASGTVVVPKVIHGSPTQQMEALRKNALRQAQDTLTKSAPFNTASSGMGKSLTLPNTPQATPN